MIKCNFLRLAAIALLYLDQEDAFWSLITIVEVFMPRDYYTKTLLGSQVNMLKGYTVQLKLFLWSCLLEVTVTLLLT